MKPNIYILIFLVLAIGSALVSNIFHQGILGIVLAIVLLIAAGLTTKQKVGNKINLVSNLYFPKSGTFL